MFTVPVTKEERYLEKALCLKLFTVGSFDLQIVSEDHHSNVCRGCPNVQDGQGGKCSLKHMDEVSMKLVTKSQETNEGREISFGTFLCQFPLQVLTLSSNNMNYELNISVCKQRIQSSVLQGNNPLAGSLFLYWLLPDQTSGDTMSVSFALRSRTKI